MKINRSASLRSAIGIRFILTACLLAWDVSLVSGQANIEAARREGKLTIYSSISLEDINILAKAFEKNIPAFKSPHIAPARSIGPAHGDGGPRREAPVRRVALQRVYHP